MARTRKKFIDPAAAEVAIAEIEALAQREGVRVALVGGLAMQIYGSDRMTADLDFIADGPLPLRDSEPLTFGGVRGLASNGVMVDIIVRDDKYARLYADALVRAIVLDGLNVVQAEHLAAMKLAAGRPKDDLDLEFLVTSEDAMDRAAAREIIRHYLGEYAAEDFDSIADEAEWKAERSRRRR